VPADPKKAIVNNKRTICILMEFPFYTMARWLVTDPLSFTIFP